MYDRLFATLEIKRAYPISKYFNKFTFLHPTNYSKCTNSNRLNFSTYSLVELIARKANHGNIHTCMQL